ncbi:MAG: hypothetical protein EU549_02105 [Promethearchaeota archaeon]|nr:MAG: hypothetical protein EU549_02105 [Candidatus Lokiarchaeota archaeon]
MPTNKKKCINCGKKIPINNDYCWSCGTDQNTGEITKQFKDHPKLFRRLKFLTSSYGGLVWDKSLKCVRCGSRDDLEYYHLKKNLEVKKSLLYPEYKYSPSFKFPICSKCADNFINWKVSKKILTIISYMWFFVSFYTFLAIRLNIKLWILIYLFSILILIGLYIALIKSKYNPNSWMDIRGYYSKVHNKFILTEYVKSKNSKEWIEYDEWLKNIKSQ